MKKKSNPPIIRRVILAKIYDNALIKILLLEKYILWKERKKYIIIKIYWALKPFVVHFTSVKCIL